MTVAFPADFYGADQVAFQRHLRMNLRRERPDGRATVGLEPRPELIGEEAFHSPAAVYTVAEVAAAICAADAVWQHDPDGFEDLMPVLLTTGGRFRLAAEDRDGEIVAHARFGGDGAEVLAKLHRSRKATLLIEVEVRDEHGGLAGTADFDIYLRLMNRASFDSMLTPGSTGG